MAKISRRTFAKLTGIGAASLALGTLGTSIALAKDDTDDMVDFPIVEFGSYPQNSDTPTPIEWLVLPSNWGAGESVLLSRHCLACRPYHGTKKDVTWEACDLRAWLNNEFLRSAFTKEEQANITRIKNLAALDNPEYGTSAGHSTDDKVACLSLQEVESFFDVDLSDSLPSDPRLIARPTQRAINEGAESGYADGCWWWLRSPGRHADRAAFITPDGCVSVSGDDARVDYYSVRPVIIASNKALTQGGAR